MSAPPRTISVATYNVLADAYIRPERYPLVAPEDFLPERRHPKLDARVEALGADVICAQEVDIAAFRRFDDRLRLLGYRGRWAHRGGGKPDGCATFVRAPWTAEAWMIVEFDDGPRKRSNRIALVGALARDGILFAVANAHLEWHPPDAPEELRTGLFQARQLVARLRGVPRAIVCCDGNAEPRSDVMETFLSAGFADAHDPSARTFVTDGRARKIDHLLHSADLVAEPAPPPPIDGNTPLPSADEPADHLPLVAAFRTKG